jgi:beta-lactamase superfamily II metal-dependent hydrolase
MAATHVINVDLADVYKSPSRGRKAYVKTLAWGDEVEVVEITAEHVEIRSTVFFEQPDGSLQPSVHRGFIKPTTSSGVKPEDVVTAIGNNSVLKVDFVDVQQGDAAVIETPKGKVVLVDAGDNQLFARYLAGRFQNSSAVQPKDVECLVVTHGDADHFSGFSEIYDSETHSRAYKRLFLYPKRVYHNGLVKRPGTVDEALQLGDTTKVGNVTVITELEEDLLAVDDAKMNMPFRKWKRALETYAQRGPIEFRRLAKGDHDAFDFLRDEQVEIEVLGPIVFSQGDVTGLRFLGKPNPNFDLAGSGRRFSGKSVGHTINGHSILFRLRFGNVRFLFAGDLNEEAELDLIEAHDQGEISLESEVLKVPHHGSADFLPEFLERVSPVISVVSSGDENERKEYIHPRANLMGALGRHSRIEKPLIFVTELVAFFRTEGFITPEFHRMQGEQLEFANGEVVIDTEAQERGRFFAFSRAAFGIVKMRTDGQRVLVYTYSGQTTLKEAYAYRVDAGGAVVPERVKKV